MSQYVITIIPVGGDDEFAGPVSQTIVRIDTDSGHTWVKELTIRAADGTGMSGDELPEVDFAMLVRAFNRHGAQPAASPVPASPNPVTIQPARPRAAASGLAGKPGAAKRAAGRSEAGKAGRLRTGRAYRRAPSAEELETAYEQTGTIAGVASHFGVPVHTAQGWISRLRRNTELAG